MYGSVSPLINPVHNDAVPFRRVRSRLETLKIFEPSRYNELPRSVVSNSKRTPINLRPTRSRAYSLIRKSMVISDDVPVILGMSPHKQRDRSQRAYSSELQPNAKNSISTRSVK